MRGVVPVLLCASPLGCASPGDDEPTGGPADATPPWLLPDAPPSSMPDAGPGIRERCFPDLGDPSLGVPDYDQFGPVVGSHCAGTNHQEIAQVERVVFLGDSITQGTPPTPSAGYYRNLLAESLRARFGAGLEVDECSRWGARADDLLGPPRPQLPTCFPAPEPKRTLVIMTVGGNDMLAILEGALGGDTIDQSLAKVDEAVALVRDAVAWFYADPARFPAGVSVVFANVYELTDGVADFPEACPFASLAGVTDGWPQGRQVLIRMNEELMRVAVETDTDLIFLSETFCGHGLHAGEPGNECFRGEDAETWFDFTCIHPNPAGHRAIAEAFLRVVEE